MTATAAVVLHYFVKSMGAKEDRPFSTQKRIEVVRLVTNHIMLLLTIATTISGFKDLSTILLCYTQTISTELLILLGFSLAASMTIGSGLSWFDLYLRWRSRKQQTASFTSPAGEKM
jgi:hypothetical protein